MLDLRRQLEKGASIYDLSVQDVITKTPVVAKSGTLAIDALNMLKERNISCMPVINHRKVMGTIRLQDIISVGIVG